MLLIVNGPNLNLLGEREPRVYGSTTLEELEGDLTSLGDELGEDLLFFQSNHEGEIIDFLHAHRKVASGVLINPGALTHYSYSLRDALEAIELTVVEVHISDIAEREEFRRKSVVEPVAAVQIAGKGLDGYFEGLRELVARAGDR
ncbi:MAG: type II 3-dehydroquinate dehydratase [Candidatus Bipolaricaulota bacterium]